MDIRPLPGNVVVVVVDLFGQISRVQRVLTGELMKAGVTFGSGGGEVTQRLQRWVSISRKVFYRPAVSEAFLAEQEETREQKEEPRTGRPCALTFLSFSRSTVSGFTARTKEMCCHRPQSAGNESLLVHFQKEFNSYREYVQTHLWVSTNEMQRVCLRIKDETGKNVTCFLKLVDILHCKCFHRDLRSCSIAMPKSWTGFPGNACWLG